MKWDPVDPDGRHPRRPRVRPGTDEADRFAEGLPAYFGQNAMLGSHGEALPVSQMDVVDRLDAAGDDVRYASRRELPRRLVQHPKPHVSQASPPVTEAVWAL